VNLNTTAVSEHIADIEQHIRLIKERARAIRSTMPFKIIPGRMIIEMMAHVVLWLNASPPRAGCQLHTVPELSRLGPRLILPSTARSHLEHTLRSTKTWTRQIRWTNGHSPPSALAPRKKIRGATNLCHCTRVSGLPGNSSRNFPFPIRS
jgi:hypothetical protein